jgi:hypothetical protein
MRVGVRLAAALVVIALQMGSAGAATCQQAQLSAAGKQTDGKLRCETRAVKLGAAVDAECLDSVEIEFQRAFLNAENRGGCLDTADAGVVGSAIDQCVASILAALGASSPPPPPAVCLQAKLKASGKRASAKMSCWARAAARNDVLDESCVARAESRFDGAFAKAELRGDCARTGDAAAVAAAVDTCVQDVVDLLQPATTSTTTVIPSSTSTTLPEVCGGNEPAALAGVTAAHNAVRASASPTPNPPLAPYCWNATVAATAQAWADGCQFKHNPDLGSLGYGENIYAAGSGGSKPGLAAVALWASEAANYNYANNSCSGSGTCLHYTQIVWRTTQAIGCGVQNCATNSPFGGSAPNWTLVVCDYDPPGNYRGYRPY